METIPDIIRGFRAADGEVLRIAGAEAEPFAAVDPRHLRVEAAAGASARIVVLHTAPDVSSLTLTLAEAGADRTVHGRGFRRGLGEAGRP